MSRRRSIACAMLLFASSCEPGDSDASEDETPLRTNAGTDARELFSRLETVIRQDAARSYSADCGSIEVPDRALIPVEITGGGIPELAVTFGRVRCGAGLTLFSGTGGVMVQFWNGEAGPVRLILEQQMHGFTPTPDGLVTMQHGGYCPGGAGPDQCRVTYRWNERDRRLEVTERRLASEIGTVEVMKYDYATISR